MTRVRAEREKVIVAVLSKVAVDAYHDLRPENYGAMASAELADDALDEALAEYVEAYLLEAKKEEQ